MWKASEWKWWLLFYAVPCLDGILEKKYHEHMCLLVNGIFLLLKDEILKNDLKEAMDNLSKFVYEVEELYGKSAMTFNVHQLLHLPQSVRQLGPLWSHSTFVFESGNGTLLNLISDANGVPLQVIERFAMRLQLFQLLQSVTFSEKARALCQKMTAASALEKPPDRPLGKGFFSTDISHEEPIFLEKLGYCPKNVVEHKRVCLKGQAFHVHTYQRTKRTCNSYLKSKDGERYVLNKVFVLEDGMCVLLCRKLICLEHKIVNHMHICTDVGDEVLLYGAEVDRVCVAMKVGKTLYIADIPNMHERE